jgi:small subunit ribosomal protein S21
MGIKVEAGYGENAENLVRRFNKIVEKTGLLREMREREHFEKPSVKNRRDKIRMQKNAERQRRFQSRQLQKEIF